MPSLSCRDSGADCDWYYNGLDTGDVLGEDFRHSIRGHLDVMLGLVKEIREKKKQLSVFIPWLISRMKNLNENPAAAACKNIGIDCEFRVAKGSYHETLIEWLKHLEAEHWDEVDRSFMERKAHYFVDLVSAIER
jgi:predicted small metal-binding protein